MMQGKERCNAFLASEERQEATIYPPAHGCAVTTQHMLHKQELHVNVQRLLNEDLVA